MTTCGARHFNRMHHLRSTRGVLAIIMGCVPVFVGNFLRPFQSILGMTPFNYSKFSITGMEVGLN